MIYSQLFFQYCHNIIFGFRRRFYMNKEFESPTWDEYFMLQAQLAKLRSNCISRQIGAIIVQDHKPIVMSYNGTPYGVKSCYEGGCPRCYLRKQGKISPEDNFVKCICNHAEANAMTDCTVLVDTGIKDITLYTTFVICLDCSKMAITKGIKKIVCLGSYPESETVFQFLHDSGVEIVILDKTRINHWIQILLEEPTASLMPK